MCEMVRWSQEVQRSCDWYKGQYRHCFNRNLKQIIILLDLLMFLVANLNSIIYFSTAYFWDCYKLLSYLIGLGKWCSVSSSWIFKKDSEQLTLMTPDLVVLQGLNDKSFNWMSFRGSVSWFFFYLFMFFLVSCALQSLFLTFIFTFWLLCDIPLGMTGHHTNFSVPFPAVRYQICTEILHS